MEQTTAEATPTTTAEVTASASLETAAGADLASASQALPTEASPTSPEADAAMANATAPASAAAAEPGPATPTSAAAAPALEAQEAPSSTRTGVPEATEPEPEAEIPPHVLACMESVRATSFESELNEQVLLKLLRKNLKRIETWESWSEPAKLAFSHLLAAEVLHAQAAQIHIGSGIAFHPKSSLTYQDMLLAVRVREPRRV